MIFRRLLQRAFILPTSTVLGSDKKNCSHDCRDDHDIVTLLSRSREVHLEVLVQWSPPVFGETLRRCQVMTFEIAVHWTDEFGQPGAIHTKHLKVFATRPPETCQVWWSLEPQFRYPHTSEYSVRTSIATADRSDITPLRSNDLTCPFCHSP